MIVLGKEGEIMKKYVKLIEKPSDYVNDYLEKGWEIIQTSKQVYSDGDSILYHLGLPLEVAYQEALNEIARYKMFELDKVLDEKIKEASKSF